MTAQILVIEPSFVSWGDPPRSHVAPYFPLIHYVRELPVVVGNLRQITATDVSDDLAPLSPEECARRGIRHSSEDFADEEMIELPAPEFRRNVLLAAAERTKL